MPVSRLTNADRLALLAFSFALLVPGMGASLFDRDEGWYAQVSREMLAGGDWLVPRYRGEVWLAKPPLLYWGVAAAYRFFGVSDWSARLVSVLAMGAAVQLVATLGAGLFDRRTGLLGAICFLTSALPLIVGKMLLTDGVLLVWCVGAAVLLWRIVRSAGRSTAASVGFWACVGLGMLTKGPAILLFVGALGLAVLWASRTRQWVRRPLFWLSAGVAVGVAGPWYVYIARVAGDRLWSQFLWFETFSRIGGAPHGHAGPPGYHLAVALAGLLPWTALVPGALIEAWKRGRTEPACRILLAWLGIAWLVLELVRSKLPHYALPCYVPVGLLLGRMWNEALDAPGHAPVRRTERVVLAVWAVVPMVIGGILLSLAAWWRDRSWALPLGVLGTVVLVGFAAVGWLALGDSSGPALSRHGPGDERRGVSFSRPVGGRGPAWAWVRGVLMRPVAALHANRAASAFMLAAGTIGLFHIVAGFWLLPALEPHRLSRRIAERVNALAGPGDGVFVSGYEEPTMFFYLRHAPQVVSPGVLAGLLVDGASGPASGPAGGPPMRILVGRESDWRREGVVPGGPTAEWDCLDGLNYGRMEWVTVWIARVQARAGASTGGRASGHSRRYHSTVAGMPS